MNARSIVLRYLRRHGHAGLCLIDEPFSKCSCGIEDFAPCGEGPYPECQPARRGLPGELVYVPIFQHRRADD